MSGRIQIIGKSIKHKISWNLRSRKKWIVFLFAGWYLAICFHSVAREECYPPSITTCPVVPPSCIDFRCVSRIAEWKIDGNDRRKKYPVMEYTCPQGTSGSFNALVAAQAMRNECVFSSDTSTSGYKDIANDLSWILCFKIGECASVGLRLDIVSGYESKRWVGSENQREDVGTSAIYEARCIREGNNGRDEELIWLACLGEYRACQNSTSELGEKQGGKK